MELKQIEDELKQITSRKKYLLELKRQIKVPKYVKRTTLKPLNDQQKTILDELHAQKYRCITLKDLALLIKSSESHNIVSKLVREYLKLEKSKPTNVNGKTIRTLLIGQK